MSTLLFFIFTIIAYLLYYLIRSMKRPANYPPGPSFLPITGNTMQLRKEARALGGQHIVLEQWSQQFNSDILGLKLGKEFVVYLNNYKLVRDVQLQEVFEARPDNFFIRLRTMGTRQGITCTEGKLWHEHRNFAMRQMRNVGYGRTQMEAHIQSEAESLLAYIAELKCAPIWPGSFLAPSVINVLWSLTAGTRIGRDDKRLVRLLELLSKRSKLFDMCGGLLSQFPWLRHIAPDKTGYRLICQLNEELYYFLMESINEHLSNLNEKPADMDLIYAYLHEMQQHSHDLENSTFNETQLIMTILDFFIAGSQTTSTTLDLALMMLAVRSDLQQKVYEEILANLCDVSGEELLSHTTRQRSPYLDAFIMEVQRYFHIVPVSGPRRALWATKIAGYDIPKNTTILIGLRSVHMDAEHWHDPDVFRPERFITDDGQIFKDDYFMPFGIGRRRCLGDALARACIFTFLYKIVQRFAIEVCEDERPSMKLLPGITLSPKPYKVRFVERT